jgi:hypothetical protein
MSPALFDQGDHVLRTCHEYFLRECQCGRGVLNSPYLVLS